MVKRRSYHGAPEDGSLRSRGCGRTGFAGRTARYRAGTGYAGGTASGVRGGICPSGAKLLPERRDGPSRFRDIFLAKLKTYGLSTGWKSSI
jgi:hypothetical protein